MRMKLISTLATGTAAIAILTYIALLDSNASSYSTVENLAALKERLKNRAAEVVVYSSNGQVLCVLPRGRFNIVSGPSAILFGANGKKIGFIDELGEGSLGKNVYRTVLREEFRKGTLADYVIEKDSMTEATSGSEPK
jgi:hypothetical protein